MTAMRFDLGWTILGLLTLMTSLPAYSAPPDPYAAARKKMVDRAVVRSGVTDRRVIRSMLETPRHEFIPQNRRHLAYFDMGVPIGESQTISSPFIVAYMTQSLEPQPTDKVLEIGTGSGYQAAVLSPLVKEVYTIEIVEELGQRARATLERLGYTNIHTRIGDGFKGWPEKAPFDKIIVTCSPEKVPAPLVEQLAEGGLMVIPVGERYQQTLYRFRKVNGRLKAQPLRPTLFVPMTGRAEEGRQVQPDPSHPRILNGSFEKRPGKDGFIPNWYYQRQTEWMESEDAPDGRHYVRFRNRQPGRTAHLFQGLAIDGRKVTRIIFSAKVATKNVRTTGVAKDGAVVGIILYDEDRKEVARETLNILYGDAPWRTLTRTLAVPVSVREAIVSVGLFGATGEMKLDSVRLEIAGTQ